MVNNAAIVLHLARKLQDSEEGKSDEKPMREALKSDPCLLTRLPTSAFIVREAERLAPHAIETELERLARPPTPEPPPEEQDGTSQDAGAGEETKSDLPSPSRSPSGFKSLKSLAYVISSMSATQKQKPRQPVVLKRAPEQWEIFRAIEKKDLMYLSEVRNRYFTMLLRYHGDATPIVYALRIGKSHEEVALFMLGMFSKYVNEIPDDDFGKPEAKEVLKLLRLNLGLAIDFGLQTHQQNLIPSFMQTLVMSEGEQWVKESAAHIASLLHDKGAKPVASADTAVRRFFTPRLKNANMILGVEEYIANAATDLVIMGAWLCVMERVKAEPIPAWYFARDDRVYGAFKERLSEHRDAVSRLNRRLRWQLRVLRTILQGQSLSFHGKLSRLAEEFDNETSRDTNYNGYDSS